MCCMSETRLGQFTYEMGRFNTAAPLGTDCYQTPTIKFIVPCLQKQGHLIFKGLHQVAQYHAAQPRAAGFQLEGFAWREAVITRALPEVSLLVLPSDGWRVLPADLQVYPPIWRAGGWLIHWEEVIIFHVTDSSCNRCSWDIAPLWCGHKRHRGRVPCSPWVDRGQKD